MVSSPDGAVLSYDCGIGVVPYCAYTKHTHTAVPTFGDNSDALFPPWFASKCTQWSSILLKYLQKPGTLPDGFYTSRGVQLAPTAWEALHLILYQTHPMLGVLTLLHEGYLCQHHDQTILDF